jgi:hypothetical protein
MMILLLSGEAFQERPRGDVIFFVQLILRHVRYWH